MAFFIDGILASEHLDSSGECLSVAGCDLSSIHRGEGIVNFEHLSQNPLQCLGKIISAKKIFSEKDCENDREKYYWDKCKCPLIYILCELFDSEVGNHVASMFKYAADHPNTGNVLGFSIEGAKLKKVGMNIVESIARKATLTAAPCNKSCIAEMVPGEEQKSEDSIFKSEPSFVIELTQRSKGKYRENFQIEPLTKREVPGSKYPSAHDVKPSPKTNTAQSPKFAPIPAKPKPENKQIGTTKSGKPVLSHAKPLDYKGFTTQDHQDAANAHMAHAEHGKGIAGATHFDTAKRHLALAGRGERQGAKVQAARQEAVKKSESKTKPLKKDGDMSASPPEPNQANAAAMQAGAMSSGPSFGQAMSNLASGLGMGKSQKPKKELKKSLGSRLGLNNTGLPQESTDKKNKRGLFNPDVDKISSKGTMVGGMVRSEKKGNLKKAMTAGSGMASPGTLSGGAALAPESVDKKMKKSQWLARAEQEYVRWEKREQFENFMAKHMPSLTKGEIMAIGQTLALRKSLRAEKKLAGMITDQGQDSWVKKSEKLNKALKFGSTEDQAKVAAAIEERKKNPPKKVGPEKKEPKLTEPIESEVSHTVTSTGHTPTGTHEFDTVHLKSGHVSHGHQKGRFKTGDRVTMRPHLMGTHILEHKK